MGVIMRMRSVLGGLAATLALSTAAEAAIVITTYEGTIVGGQDVTGLLGTPGADLTGLTYAATFTINTSVNRTTGVDGIGPFDEVVSNGLGSPFLSATFTVGATTFNLPAPDAFGAAARDGLQFLHNSLGRYSYTFNFVSPDAPALLDTPFSAAGNPSSYGSIYLYTADFADLDFYADTTIDQISSRVVTAGVPEPSTWALMILGFMGAGTALRRSKACERGLVCLPREGLCDKAREHVSSRLGVFG